MLHAVVIGINKYLDPRIAPLAYARTDAESFSCLINERFVAEDARVWLLLDGEATKRNILVTIGEDLPRVAKKDDVVVVYFAGHGSPETTAGIDEVSRYIVTHDTEYDRVFATSLDTERELTRLIERLRSDLVVVLLDTCFSGRAGGRTFEGPSLHRERGKYRRLIKLPRLEMGEGRVILTASDEREVALEDPALGHGVFTYFLLQALTESRGENETIGLTTLYELIAANVQRFTEGRQSPVMNGRVKSARLPLLGKVRSP